MDDLGTTALGRYGARLAAEHLTAGGMAVLACRRLADHRSVGTAGVRPGVVSTVRQCGEAPRLERLQEAC